MIEAADEEFLLVVVKEKQKTSRYCSFVPSISSVVKDSRRTICLINSGWVVQSTSSRVAMVYSFAGCSNNRSTSCVSMYWFQRSRFRRELVSRLEMT